MTLAEALKATGKARRESWPPNTYVRGHKLGDSFDGEPLTTVDVGAAIATDWLPYGTPAPPKKKLREKTFSDGVCMLDCDRHPPDTWVAREVSPERDAIVAEAVSAAKRASALGLNLDRLQEAVQAWINAGSPE